MNLNSEKKVLIIILNWNKKNFVLELLSQIENIEYKNYECLVVDNNSDDNSVPEIQSKFPNIKLLVNKENLGGTGGYNSGLKYALDNITCDYIWLIDNDAEINSETLSHLVKTMDNNENIGIAGSRIIDIDNKDVTIELGSFIKWDTIGVKPFLRNTNLNNFDYDYIETDYVAICSALVKFDALKKAGVMDERHFIFWDDMDWGLQFQKAGYRVVAVSKSIAYHPSFTERKRGIATDFYYGLRNPLLVYSKHTKPLLRLRIFHNFFRRYCIFLMLLLLNKRWTHLGYAFRAINDFVFNNWGKCNINSIQAESNKTIDFSQINYRYNKVLVIFDNYNDAGSEILKTIKEKIQGIEIHALIDEDRKDLYEEIFNKIIIVDVEKRKKSLWYNFKLFIKILKLNFDFSVGSSSNPYGYATKKYLIYNNREFEETGIRRSRIHSVIFSAVFGEIISLIITPIVFVSSFKYNKEK